MHYDPSVVHNLFADLHILSVSPATLEQERNSVQPKSYQAHGPSVPFVHCYFIVISEHFLGKIHFSPSLTQPYLS